MFNASGWNQARVTKELMLTSSAISQFLDVNNPAKPSDAILKLFQLVLSGPFEPIERGRAGPSGPSPIGKIRESLQAIRDQVAECEKHLDTLEGERRAPAPVINRFNEGERTPPPPSSRGVEIPESDIQASLAAGHQVVESERAAKAASTSGSKAAPSSGISRRPSGQPVSPKPAPSESGKR